MKINTILDTYKQQRAFIFDARDQGLCTEKEAAKAQLTLFESTIYDLKKVGLDDAYASRFMFLVLEEEREAKEKQDVQNAIMEELGNEVFGRASV